MNREIEVLQRKDGMHEERRRAYRDSQLSRF
jgi:hypothetical protein